MEEKYPLILERIKAITIDTLMIILLMYVFSLVLEKFENVPDWVRVTLFLGLFVFYEPIFSTYGATLGNYVMNIRVRKISNSLKRINIFQGFIRYFFKALFGWFTFSSIFFSKRNRAIHDLIAGTITIKYTSV